MTKRFKNTKQSTSARVLVPLLVFSILSALALGSGLALGASTAPAPKLVAMPAKITAARSATFKFRHKRPHMRFQCKLDRRAFVTCKLRKRYSHLVEGGQAFKVRATDGKRKSRIATFKWIIDRTPPPTPKITSGPVRLPHTTVSRTATFRFKSETGANFLCSLNSTAAAHFTSVREREVVPARPAGGQQVLRQGEGRRRERQRHRPAPLAGRASAPAPRSRRRTAPRARRLARARTTGPAEDFTIAGNAAGLLYPDGPARPIALTLHNPNDVAVVRHRAHRLGDGEHAEGVQPRRPGHQAGRLLDRDHVGERDRRAGPRRRDAADTGCRGADHPPRRQRL